VNTPVGGALDAEDDVELDMETVIVVEYPGSRPVPEHVTADEDDVAVVRIAGQVTALEKVHDDGATSVTEVIAYAFPTGFVTVSVIGVDAPATMSLGEALKDGSEAFCAANVGVAGIKKRSPEKSNRAVIVPELSFERYAFVSVFIISSWQGAVKYYISRMDELSIF
jgi:hypothetical protein